MWDSGDPFGSHDFDNYDNPWEEYHKSELNKYNGLEVINCHHDHESLTPIVTLRESVQAIFLQSLIFHLN